VECKNKPIFVKALKLCQACYKRQHRARTPILCKVCNLNRVYYKTKSLCESCWKESKKEPLQLPVPPEALPKLDLTGT
jgi:superfamily II helicase